MDSIFKNEMRVHETLEGKVSSEVTRRPGIKLNTKPRIVICMPIGSKVSVPIFDTPDGNKWQAPSVTIPAMVPIQWVNAHMRMITPLGISTSFITQWGMLSGEARQIMTARAIQQVQDDGYVLYWDDDVIVEPMSLYTLYNFMEQHPEAGAVTGVYSTRQEPTEPVLYKEHMKGAHWGVTVGPNAEPEEIFSCGAGFMLVRAAAIRDMMERSPNAPIWADSKTTPVDGEVLPGSVRFTTTWGHDIRFCALLAEAGWKLYVDGKVELGHFDSAEQKEYRLPADSPPKVRGRAKEQAPAAGQDDNSICLVLPTYGHLDYAERAARSFLEGTMYSRAVVCAVDDGSPDVTDEQYTGWAARVGIQHAKRFPENDGLTRSWNYGLRWARENGIRYVVCGNSDLVFTRKWDVATVAALEEYDLVGPVTNAAGWGTELQKVTQYIHGYEADDSSINEVAEGLVGRVPVPLGGAVMTYGKQGAAVQVDEFLNGFCLVARTDTWWVGAFDAENVFDPSHKLTENETELQARWVIGLRCRRAVVPASFVFHYRSISRGDEYKCEGAYRPEVAI